MKQNKILSIFFLLLSCNIASIAQVKTETTTVKVDIQPDTVANVVKAQKSVTEGTVTVEGKRINYQAIAGTLILKNKNDTPTCSMFYVAYFKSGDEDNSQRPVTFIYNGGPGSASLWLHMGAWGPQISNTDDTARVLPPYKTVNNDYSLLDASDLVFIDAPGTGFSRIIGRDKGGAGKSKDFYGIDGDAHAFAQFINDFLSTYNRWNSPKYLFGESYGTFRSAAVSNILETEDAVDLNGVVLLSQILDYHNSTDNVTENPGNDLAYELALPSCAATAWYHHMLPNQPEKLEPFLKEVENFALDEYAVAMLKGNSLDSISFNHIADKLHQYTGLPVDYIRKTNLRITGIGFEKTLLAGQDRITGRLDTRFTGLNMDPLSEYPFYDPQDASTSAAFVATFNNYLRTSLKFHVGIPYLSSTDLWATWDNRHLAVHQAAGDTHDNLFANVMPDLASAMIFNPKMKVMLNMGYFDLATPFMEGLFEMKHLPLPASLQNNISYEFYYSGHMVYLNPIAHKQLHDNVAKFIDSTH